MTKGIFNPNEAWSADHWLNSLGMVTLLYGPVEKSLLPTGGGGLKPPKGLDSVKGFEVQKPLPAFSTNEGFQFKINNLDIDTPALPQTPMQINFKNEMDRILKEKMEGKSDSNHSIKDVEVKAVEGTGNVNLTEPSLPKGGKPKGNYTKGDSHGIKKESETADLMTDQGYDIKMLDEVNGGNGYGIKESSNPDFLIEGKVFDCYAPTIETNVDNILRNTTKKTNTQAERIVLNLDQFPSEKVAEIIQGILRKANPNGDLKNLKELFIVKDGESTRVFGGDRSEWNMNCFYYLM
jgi:FlaG/FlaF family flagellin (archaellin)